MQYCSLQHRTLLPSPHIHNWVLFLLWLHLFILSGVSSPLISSSIVGTYRPGEFILQCPIFLPSHTVHGVLKARILKWSAVPFSRGPHCQTMIRNAFQFPLLFSHSVVSDSLRPHEPQHTRLPCPLPSPRVYSNSCPSSH